MRTYTPQKHKLADLLERLEAAVVRLEGLEPPTALIPPTDPAAQKAADDYIAERRQELLGGAAE